MSKTKKPGNEFLIPSGIIFVLVFGGLAMGLAILFGNHARIENGRGSCGMNIEAIENAKQMWMLESKKSENDVATEEDLKVLLKNGVFPVCPQGGVYAINPIKLRTTCSFHTNTLK